jgi:tyrosyl-tRNA synthetase
MLSAEEVRANAETYMQQFFKVVDKDKTETRWQSEWFGKFDLADVIRLTSKFTVAQLLAREDFNNRYAAGRPIAITELLYPLLQAYDSVAIKADVEFGGVDQKFNCLMGRELQQMIGQPRQQVFLMHLLVGTDGQQKMSKSLGNYIGVEDQPHDMYGKVMSIPDDLLMDYFELLTDVPEKELAGFRQQLAAQSVNPMILKKRLGREIVLQFHGADAAKEAESYFEKVFQKRGAPEESEEYSGVGHLLSSGLYRFDITPALLEKGLVKSRGEVKRLLAQGAIEIDGKKADSNIVEIPSGAIIQVGKRRFLKISLVKDI